MTQQELAAILAGLAAALPAIITLCRIIEPFAVDALMAKLPASRRGQLADVVHTVVTAVEQSRQNTDGKEKKAAALQAIDALVGQLGLSKYASPELVNALVEAAVFQVNQYRAYAPAVTEPVAQSVSPDAGSQATVNSEAL